MLKSENSDRPFVCSTCNERFRRPAHLTNHTALVHSALRPFACTFPLCLKTFSIKEHLTRHLKTHDRDPTPFHCSQCTECFAKKTKLRDHRLTVHGVAEFICMTGE